MFYDLCAPRSICALSFLQSDSGMENADNEAQERSISRSCSSRTSSRLASPLTEEQLATLVEALLIEIARRWQTERSAR